MLDRIDRRDQREDRNTVNSTMGKQMRSMNYLQLAAIGAVAVVATASFGARSHADAIPSGWEASNMEPVGYSGLENRKGAFKMAIKKVNGRW